MTRPLRTVFFFFLGFSLVISGGLRAGEMPQPTFYAPFDADTKTDAVISAGKPTAEGGGATLIPDGKYGGAASFTALAGIPYQIAYNLPTRKGTIAFWVRGKDWKDDDAVRVFLNAGVGAPYFTLGPFYAISKTGLKGPVAFSAKWANETPKVSWENGRWYHVAMTYQNGVVRGYIDGKEVMRQDRQVPERSPEGLFYLGTTPFMGNVAKQGETAIDDVRIYSEALNEAQLAVAMRGYNARIARLPGDKWKLTAVLDPLLRGTGGAKIYVKLFAGDKAVGGDLAPVAFKDGKAEMEIPWKDVPPGPIRIHVEARDCPQALDAFDLTTNRPPEATVRLSNEKMELGFDAVDGSLLTMKNLVSGKSYRKPLPPCPLFDLLATPFGNTALTYQSENAVHLVPTDQSCRGVRVSKDGSGQKLEIINEFEPDLKVTCTINLPNGSELSEWKIKVENRRSRRPSRDWIVHRLNYPQFNGLVLGDNDADNFLALPRIMGQLIPGPATYAGYEYADEPEKLYPGAASMSWMDLYNQDGGLYLGSHDPALPPTALMSKGDGASRTVSMGFGKYNVFWPQETYEPGPVMVGIHPGDWHWGADRYRAYWRANFAGRRKTPKWLQDADAWTGYGGPAYKFDELPKLIKGAQALGVNYLQLWSEMTLGDVNYHLVMWPNPMMGSPEALKEGIRQVHKMGGHVGFYYIATVMDPQVRFLLNQEKYKGKLPEPYLDKWFGEKSGYLDSGLIGPDGSFCYETPFAEFADGNWIRCPNSDWEQNYLESFVRQWDAYGVDCWYFDTMPVGYGQTPLCYNPRHGHARPMSVVPGILNMYRKTQQIMDHGQGAAIANEGVSDICAIYGTHALGNELAGWCQPPKPEIFRYTLPEYLIFSGNCNAIYLSFYPGYDNLDPQMYSESNRIHAYNRVFLLGDRFDLLNSFDFRADASEKGTNDYIPKLIALRQKTKAQQYESEFKDDIGLQIAPKEVKVEAKVFRHTRGESFTITLLDRRKTKSELKVTLDLAAYDSPNIGKITLFTLDRKEANLEPVPANGKVQLTVPPLAEGDIASILVMTPTAH